MQPVYNIAVLGYGSIPNKIHSDVYNTTLEVSKPNTNVPIPQGINLNPESPFIPSQGLKLPVRLGRISGAGTEKRRITQILCKGASPEMAFFAKSKFSSLDSAIKNLREREGIPQDNSKSIGYVNLIKNTSRSRLPEVADKVKSWALENGFNAVIWTDLPEKGVHFPDGSTGREIEPILAKDPLLLLNTQKYIRDLAGALSPLQKRILDMPVGQQNSTEVTDEAYKASLTNDFEARAKPENQTNKPKHKWYENVDSNWNWGPFAAEYPKPTVPQGVDSVSWKRDRVIEAAHYWVNKGIPYSSKTAHKVGQTLPSHLTPSFKLRGHFPARNCGLDCSNFVSWIYNFGLGIQFSSSVDDLANKSYSHSGAGRVLNPNEQLIKGDLILYSGSPKHITIYLDENHVIESTSAGEGLARIVDLRDPNYAYLRPVSSNNRFLLARRPIE